MSIHASQILSTPQFQGKSNFIVFVNVTKEGSINFISTIRANFLKCVKESNCYSFTLSEEWDNITVFGQPLGTSYNIVLVDKITQDSFKTIIKTTSNKISECDFSLVLYLWKSDVKPIVKEQKQEDEEEEYQSDSS